MRAVRNVCMLNFSSQKCLVQRMFILAVEVRCHKVQGMTEAFTDMLYMYSRPKTSSSG